MTIRHRFFSAVLCFAATLVLNGCATSDLHYKGQLFERKGVSMIVTPANVGATFFNDLDSSERHCLAPSADVSLTESEGVSIGAKLGGTIGSGVGEGAISLGGRSPSVLITRELLYRACELSSNLDLPPEKTLAVYDRFLRVIESIAKSQTGAGTAATGLTTPPLGSLEAGTKAQYQDADQTVGSEDQSSSFSESISTP